MGGGNCISGIVEKQTKKKEKKKERNRPSNLENTSFFSAALSQKGFKYPLFQAGLNDIQIRDD